jgi:glycosyltransferase involved in cell wall biosynthesis
MGLPAEATVKHSLISVVMVVCNSDRFLADSIESILSQSFRNFEFIIVDFGSTDNSRSIISEYAARDSRVKLHMIPNCGLAEARNNGCYLAQGQYIAVMDSDDVAVPDRLQREVEFLEKHTEVGVVGGATELIDSTGKVFHVNHFPRDDREIRSAFLDGCPFCQPTVLMRRDAFVFAGGYRRVFAQAEDYDLWLRIAEHFQCANLEEVVLKYRIHPNQISLRKRMQQSLCVLAAQASATARRNKTPDPLDSVREITTAELTRMGVSEAKQQSTTAGGYLFWIRTMYMAGEYSAALRAAIEVLQSDDSEHIERWQVADIRLMTARLYWKQGKFVRSIFTALHACVTRPIMLGRPVKSLLSRLLTGPAPQSISCPVK